MALDEKQSKAFDCSTCDVGLQRLRNCCGSYGEKSKSIMIVNGIKYDKCPRSVAFNHHDLEYLAGLFFDCHDKKIWPFGMSKVDQTSFLDDSFSYMENIVNIYRSKQQEEMERDMKKSTK